MVSFYFGSWAILILLSSIFLNGKHTTFGFANFNDDDYRKVFPNNEDNGTLKLVNVMFRHGNRTICENELYPLNPHLNKTYFPYGLGQLTNAGKQKLYTVGTRLRNRYNDFLGKYYYPEIVEALTTDYNRTKMSLQLVLAGLFPLRKEEIILGIPWQPIPYNFVAEPKDRILSGAYCPPYLKLYKEYINSPSVQNKFKKHENLLKYISEHTGLDVKTFKQVHNIQFGLDSEREYGLPLPDWTNSVADQMLALSQEEYSIAMGTPDLRKMAIGFFLHKIIEDAKFKIRDDRKLSRKIYVYSAHENNIAQLLIALGVFDKHIPAYGAFIILELHKIKDVYGFKVYYERWDGKGLRLLKIPGCKQFCPIDVFTSLIAEYLPTDLDMYDK